MDYGKVVVPHNFYFIDKLSSLQGQTNEQHTIICTCDAGCAGTFTIEFKGQITGRIPYDAPAALIQKRLEVRVSLEFDSCVFQMLILGVINSTCF